MSNSELIFSLCPSRSTFHLFLPCSLLQEADWDGSHFLGLQRGLQVGRSHRRSEGRRRELPGCSFLWIPHCEVDSVSSNRSLWSSRRFFSTWLSADSVVPELLLHSSTAVVTGYFSLWWFSCILWFPKQHCCYNSSLWISSQITLCEACHLFSVGTLVKILLIHKKSKLLMCILSTERCYIYVGSVFNA